MGVRRHLGREHVEQARVADVHDQRVIGRPPLRGEDAGDRRGVGGVGPEAEHRLGREGHQVPRGEGAGGVANGVAERGVAGSGVEARGIAVLGVAGHPPIIPSSRERPSANVIPRTG